MNFPMGTQYYRPPTPKQEYWESDFQLMQKSGFNIVRAWAMWSWINPKEGVYDFSELDRLCDLAQKYSLRMILLTNIESSPAWLYRKYPDMLYVDRYGKKIVPHTVHNTCCGGFPGQCVDWPEIKESSIDFIENLVKHFSNHPSLYAWEPHNEPLYEPSRYHHEVYCYCEKTLEKFKGWLKDKYGTVNALNNVWQRRFSCFEEVFPPVERGSYADWVDWRLFAIENLVDQDFWRTQTIRDNDPNHPILMHTRAGSACRNVVCDCTDDWRLSKLADKFGYANFPQGHTFIDHALAGDICRSAAQGKEFWLHELQSGPYGIGLNIPKTDEITADRMASWTWLSIAQGAKGVLYWQFRTEQFGAEYGFNLVNLDGTSNERLKIASRIAECIKENEEIFHEMEPRPAEIGLGFSPFHPMLTYVASGEVIPYDDSYLGINRLISHSGFSVDILRMDVQAVYQDFDRYKAIYLPLPLWLDRETSEKLARFVEQGGTLISEPSLGFLGEDFFSSSLVPGMGLDKVFGCHREFITNHQDKRIIVNLDSHKIYSRYLQEILIPASADVIGTYDNGEPAVTVNNYGKGRAIYLGTNIFMEYQHNPEPAVGKVLTKLFHPDLTPFVRASESDIVIKVAERNKQKLICLFNTTSKSISTRLIINASVYQALDIYNVKEVLFANDKVESWASFELKPYDSRILLVE